VGKRRHVFSVEDNAAMAEANAAIFHRGFTLIPRLYSIIERWHIPLENQEIKPYGASVALAKAFEQGKS